MNFYNDEGEPIPTQQPKKRPQSSKPPKFITSYQAPIIQNMDWDSEYEYQMKQKTGSKTDEIFNILDNQINKLSQGEMEDEDLGIQEINDEES